jgi:hypothetical protein
MVISHGLIKCSFLQTLGEISKGTGTYSYMAYRPLFTGTPLRRLRTKVRLLPDFNSPRNRIEHISLVFMLSFI